MISAAAQSDPTTRVCLHPRLVAVFSEGGDTIGYQCARCPATWGHCRDCGTPMNSDHQKRIGCTRCGRGKFCNVITRLCRMCAPAVDGVCEGCRAIYPRTGRQMVSRRRFCSRKCQCRARRRRRGDGR